MVTFVKDVVNDTRRLFPCKSFTCVRNSAISESLCGSAVILPTVCC